VEYVPGAGLNFLAIVVAGLTGFPRGFLWYGPLFEKPWMAALGRTRETTQAPPPLHWALIAAGSLISAFTIAIVLSWAGVTSAFNGAAVALLLGGGLIGTDSLKLLVYEGRSKVLLNINNGYTLVHFAIMGAILGAWR
jgi:Protein of unknown function (DUF1761)